MALRRLRIAILVFVLVTVALFTWQQQARVASWKQTLPVEIYPINGDGSPDVDVYLSRLTPELFAPIGSFLSREAKAFGLSLDPVIRLALHAPLGTRPPEPPRASDRLGVMWWSLKLRYWVFRNVSNFSLRASTARIFVIYHKAERNKKLQHSLGLQKGLIGVVHAFAHPEQRGPNNVIIAHELLHTFGATDKYGPDNLPLYPDGYGEPDREPRFPQEWAEIMGGRMVISANEAKIPESLASCLIGPKTAAEINWQRGK